MAGFWENLRLSRDPFFQNAPPELAAAYGSGIRSILDSPEIKERLQKLGQYDDAIGTLDVPLSAQGVAQERAGRHQLIRSGTGPVEAIQRYIGIAAGLGQWQGTARRMGVGAADFLKQYGIGRGGAGSQLPEDIRDRWIIGRTDPIAAATQLASNFAPFFLGTGAAAAGLGRVGLQAGAGFKGGLASMLSFGLGGGGVNALEQGGRAVLQGEKIDPQELAQEAAIFAAGGIPAGNVMAGVLTGAAATAVPVMQGKSPDWTRVGSEALFGLIFGNPRYRASRAKVTSRDLDDMQKRVLTEAANEAQPGPIREELSARADMIDKAKEQDVVTLQQAVEQGGPEGLVARDALAAKSGQIVPPDAPRGNVFTPEQSEILSILRSMDEATMTAAKDQVTGDRRQIISNALALVRDGKAVDGSIFRGTPLETAAASKEIGHMPPTKDVAQSLAAEAATDRAYDLALRGTGTDATILRHLAPEWEAELQQLSRRLAGVQNAPGADPAELKTLTDNLSALRQQVNDRLTGKEPWSISGPDQARRVLTGMMGEMSPAQLRAFSRDLPEAFVPFEREARALIADRMTRKPKVDPLDKELDDLQAALEREGFVLHGQRMEVRPEEPVPENLQALIDPAGKAETIIAHEPEFYHFSGLMQAASPQAKRTAISLLDLRKQAANWNAQVHPIEEGGKLAGFELHADGKSYYFNTMKKLRDFMEALEEGKITDLGGLEMAGARRGNAITHVGDGRIMTSDMISGEQVIHPDLKTAAEHVVAKPEPEVKVDIAGEAMVPGMGGVPPSGSQPRPPVDQEFLENMPSEFNINWGTAKDVLLRLQDAIGTPVYDEVWRPLMDGMRERNIFQKPFAVELRKLFSGIRPGRYGAIQEVLLGGAKRAEMAEAVGLRRGELRVVKGLERWYKKLLDLDEDGLTAFLDEMKVARAANGDPSRMHPDWRFSGALTEVLDDVFSGHLALDNKNALSMAQEMLMQVGRNRYLRAPLKSARRVANQHIFDKLKAMKGKSDKDIKALTQAEEYIRSFIDRVDNHVDASARQVANFLNNHYTALKRIGLIKGDEWTPHDIERLSMMTTSYLSGVAMSARVALATRNLWQMMLNAPKVGFTNTFLAMKDALSPEGRALVREARIAEVPTMFLMDEISTIDPGILPKVLKLQRLGLTLYRGADYANRSVSYHAGRRAIDSNFKLLQDGKVDEFLYRTGLIGDSPSVQRRILKIYENATPENMASAKARMQYEYGKHLVEDTQYVYNRANAPKNFQSLWGRLFGQFGLWNISFLEYNRRQLGGLSKTLYHMASIISPGHARNMLERYQKNFLLRQIALRSGILAMGAATGVAVHNWNMANPLAFEGGPAFQLAKDVVTVETWSGDEFDRKVAHSNIARHFQETINPFGAFSYDVYEASQEPDPLIALALMLGFNIKTTKERLNERRRQFRQ